MNKIWFKWILLAISIIVVITALILARVNHKQGICSESKVIFNVEASQQFVSQNAILKHLDNHNYKWKGLPTADIDLTRLEHILRKQPFVKEVDCYLDLRNRLVIEIEQRQPILRVYPNVGNPYYVDEEGGTFPLSNLFSADVVVASGNISPTMNKILYTIASTVHQSTFWEPFIEHIFVKNNGNLVLTTQISGHEVILGPPIRIEGKLAKLEKFYKNALMRTGWDQFKEINLEFKDQVICRK